MNNNRNNNRGRKVKNNEPKHKINNKITAPQVRLVGDNVTVGLYPISEALEIADGLDLDLVEINSKASPIIVKAIDYEKFLYIEKRAERERLKKQRESRVVTKELRFGPNTDDHDFQFKLKHAEKFLKDGNRVKAFVFFKGREMIHRERGEILLLKFVQELEDLGVAEGMPKLEGKRLNVFIKPRK